MGAPTPWSIKGIGPEARDAAKAAAKREGMTLGAWITKRVVELDADDASPAAPQPAPDAAAGAAPAAPAPSSDAMSRLEALVGALGERIEGLSEDVAQVAGRVDEAGVRVEIAERAAEIIADSIEKTQHRAAESESPAPTSDGESLGAALERALGPLATRLDALTAGAAETTSMTERAIDTLSSRLSTATNRQEEMSTAVGAAVAALAQRLDAVEDAVSSRWRSSVPSAPADAAPERAPVAVAPRRSGATLDDALRASVDTAENEPAPEAEAEPRDARATDDAAPQISPETLRAFAEKRAPDETSDDAPDGAVPGAIAPQPTVAPPPPAARPTAAPRADLAAVRERLLGATPAHEEPTKDSSLRESLSTLRSLIPGAATGPGGADTAEAAEINESTPAEADLDTAFDTSKSPKTAPVDHALQSWIDETQRPDTPPFVDPTPQNATGSDESGAATAPARRDRVATALDGSSSPAPVETPSSVVPSTQRGGRTERVNTLEGYDEVDIWSDFDDAPAVRRHRGGVLYVLFLFTTLFVFALFYIAQLGN